MPPTTPSNRPLPAVKLDEGQRAGAEVGPISATCGLSPPPPVSNRAAECMSWREQGAGAVRDQRCGVGVEAETGVAVSEPSHQSPPAPADPARRT
jgi:hypothetical protein